MTERSTFDALIRNPADPFPAVIYVAENVTRAQAEAALESERRKLRKEGQDPATWKMWVEPSVPLSV